MYSDFFRSLHYVWKTRGDYVTSFVPTSRTLPLLPHHCSNSWERNLDTNQDLFQVQLSKYFTPCNFNSPPNLPWLSLGSDQQYALITEATISTANTPGGLGAILSHVDHDGKFYSISYASRQLNKHKKNYSPFLLKAATAVWVMDNFTEYLNSYYAPLNNPWRN